LRSRVDVAHRDMSASATLRRFGGQTGVWLQAEATMTSRIAQRCLSAFFKSFQRRRDRRRRRRRV